MARPVYGYGQARRSRPPIDPGLPAPPAGHGLIADTDGALLVDSDGAYLYRRES